MTDPEVARLRGEVARLDEELGRLAGHVGRLTRVVLRAADRDGRVTGLLDEAGLLGRPGAEEEAAAAVSARLGCPVSTEAICVLEASPAAGLAAGVALFDYLGERAEAASGGRWLRPVDGGAA